MVWIWCCCVVDVVGGSCVMKKYNIKVVFIEEIVFFWG